jgi:hypothetical protein
MTQIAPQLRRSRYQEIADDLRIRINNGTYPVGSALPTLSVLAAEYGCSQMTTRNAIGVLCGQRLVRSHQGMGNFVISVSPDVVSARMWLVRPDGGVCFGACDRKFVRYTLSGAPDPRWWVRLDGHYVLAYDGTGWLVLGNGEGWKGIGYYLMREGKMISSFDDYVPDPQGWYELRGLDECLEIVRVR